MVEKSKYIWFDGKFVNWEEAQVHILTHSLHYGVAVFEGIRAYLLEDGGSAMFRVREHLERLHNSAKIVQMDLPYDIDTIIAATAELFHRNGLKEGYMRHIAWLGDGAMGVYPADNPVRIACIIWPWGAYLGADGLEQGISCRISSFTRHHPNVMMTKAKVAGNYVNSVLAKREALQLGYQEAILLDPDGYVAEGSGENIFIVEKGRLKTPPLTSILGGITRDSVLTVARELGLEYEEQRFTRDELYIADEAFFTGTAAEITPIREVDKRIIGAGKRGPVTAKIQNAFFEIVRGKNKKFEKWLTRF